MKHLCLSFLILIFFSSYSNAQKKSGDEYYELFKYSKAIPDYEKYLTKNPNDYEVWNRIALCYKNTNAVEKAANSYLQMMKLPESTPNDIYQLIQMYRIMQRFEEAKRYALEYKQKVPGSKAENLLTSIEQFPVYNATVNDFNVEDKTNKFPFSVLSVYPNMGNLIVSAENEKGRVNAWTGRGYTDLFVTDGTFGKLTPFAPNLMTPLEDGMPSFSPDKRTMVWTCTNKNSVSENSINTRKLHLLFAKKDTKENWQIDTALFQFNSNAYNTAHPTISPDGTLLVFASDMPGGKGGMDLYLCQKANNSWTAPKAIDVLNTEGNEIFPMFQPDGNLVFSSTGFPGMGGLDMFESKYSSSGFSNPQNLKAPLNSSYDDYNLIYTSAGDSGYLTSNRSGNMSIDHIYSFSKRQPTTPPVASKQTEQQEVALKILVKDKYTSIPLPYVSVSVKDGAGNVLHKGITDENGEILVEDLPKGNYTLQGILNDVTTTVAKIGETDFAAGVKLISREVTHNDPRFTMKGVALNTATGKPVSGVKVVCQNTSLNLIKTVVTGDDGSFFFQLEQKSNYRVNGEKKGWLSSAVAEETTMNLDRSTQLYVRLTLNLEQPTNKAIIRLNNIQYDYDKCDIKPKAALELNRLIGLMNDYPDMTIELGSHTDARGSEDYNKKLSQCRADAAVNYLLSKGISIARLTAKGYGETKLLNKCANGVSCNEEQHQENRRTEFTIVSCSTCP